MQEKKGLIYVWNWLYKEEGGHLAFQKADTTIAVSIVVVVVPTGVAKGCETRCFLAWEPLQ